MDPGSPWHVSGLFSTALETMTLPSRLRSRNGQRETLDQLSSAINVNGNQNIAKLQMSITNKTESEQEQGSSIYSAEQKDIRMRESNGHYLGDHSEDLEAFDMDFFPSSELPTGVYTRGPQFKKEAHIFGQVESSRGSGLEDVRDDSDGQERARRRAAGLSIIHK